MKIYHYTKQYHLYSIFTDGFIATEKKRGHSNTANVTDYVWLTESIFYPKTALPYVSKFAYTNLCNHVATKHLYVDWEELSAYVGNAYRFSFDSNDKRFKKWFFCEERKKCLQNNHWVFMENIANKVSDNTRLFWIANNDIMLDSFSLEVYKNKEWVSLLENVDLFNADNKTVEIINKLKTISANTCNSLNVPLQALRLAA